MSFAKYKTKNHSENIVISFLKGLIISVLISFALIILLAFSLKWFSIDEKYIVPINTAIKVISVIIGSSIAIKGSQGGLAKGVIFGLLYIFLAFLCFSFLSKTFSFDLSVLLDVACACLSGGIVGIIKVNSK